MIPSNPLELLFGLGGIAGSGFEWLLEAGLKGVLLMLAGFALDRVARHHAAAFRHAVWVLVLTALLVLPLLSPLLPRWQAPFPSAWLVAQQLSRETLRPAFAASRVVRERVPAMADNDLQPTSAENTGGGLQALVLLGLVWLLGCLLCLLRSIAGFWSFRRQAASCRIVCDRGWLDPMDDLRRGLQIERPVALLMGENLSTPLTGRIRRPVILIPAQSAGWSEETRRIVLLHELAHVLRRDLLFQYLANVVCALYWFNPLVWVAARRLRLESERACDDLVLGQGIRPSVYAEHLVHLARFWSAPHHAVSSLAMAGRSQLEKRVLSVLEKGRSRSEVRDRVLLGLALAASVVVFPLATLSAGRAGSSGTVFLEGTGQIPPPPEPPSPPPAPPQAPAVEPLAPPPPPPPYANRSEGDRDADLSFSSDGSRVNIRLRNVRLRSDYSGVESIGEGGSLRIQENKSDRVTVLEILPSADGTLQRSFTIDGREADANAEMDAFLRRNLRRLAELDAAAGRVSRNAAELSKRQEELRASLEREKEALERMKERMAATLERSLQGRPRLEEQMSQLQEELRSQKGRLNLNQQQIREEVDRSMALAQREMREAQRSELQMQGMQEELQRQRSRMNFDQQRVKEEMERSMAQARREMRVAQQRMNEVSELLTRELTTELRQQLAEWELELSNISLELRKNVLERVLADLSKIIAAGKISVDDDVVRFEAAPETLDRILREQLEATLEQLQTTSNPEVEEALRKLARRLSELEFKKAR